MRLMCFVFALLSIPANAMVFVNGIANYSSKPIVAIGYLTTPDGNPQPFQVTIEPKKCWRGPLTLEETAPGLTITNTGIGTVLVSIGPSQWLDKQKQLALCCTYYRGKDIHEQQRALTTEKTKENKPIAEPLEQSLMQKHLPRAPFFATMRTAEENMDAAEPLAQFVAQTPEGGALVPVPKISTIAPLSSPLNPELDYACTLALWPEKIEATLCRFFKASPAKTETVEPLSSTRSDE